MTETSEPRPITAEEFVQLHRDVEDAQRRFIVAINREIGDLPQRLTKVFNEWEDALADLHPDLEVEVGNWAVTPEGASSFMVNIKYPPSLSASQEAS